MRKEKLIESWKTNIIECAKCISESDYNKLDTLMENVNKIVKEIENHDKYFSNEITNFGILNHLVEKNMSMLSKKEKEFLTEWVALIKKDRNLKQQFTFYKGLSASSKLSESKEYVNESIKLVEKNIDKEKLEESNLKAFNLLKKHEIILENDLNEAEKNFYDSCQFLLSNSKTSLTLSEHLKAINNVSIFLENKEEKLSNKINEINKTIQNTLTETEQNILNKVFGSNEIKENYFNEVKDECTKLVNENLKKIEDDEDGEKLKMIKESIENKQFNTETFVTDIINLLDVKEILK